MQYDAETNNFLCHHIVVLVWLNCLKYKPIYFSVEAAQLYQVSTIVLNALNCNLNSELTEMSFHRQTW